MLLPAASENQADAQHREPPGECISGTGIEGAALFNAEGADDCGGDLCVAKDGWQRAVYDQSPVGINQRGDPR